MNWATMKEKVEDLSKKKTVIRKSLNRPVREYFDSKLNCIVKVFK